MKMSQRIFALSIAVIFGLSAVAVSIFAIYEMTQKNKQQDVTNQALEAQKQAEANKNDVCMQPSSGSALPAPEVYKAPAKAEKLETTDLEAGDGAEAKANDCLIVKYYGSLASNGTMFDENYTKADNLSFRVGQGQVIEGWDKGLIGMKVNGTRRLVIPAAQAYGAQANGQIPANSDLVFTVKLLEIKN